MKRTLALAGLLAFTLSVASTSLNAQPRYGDSRYGDPRYGGRYESRPLSPVNQVLSNLTRLGSYAWVDHHERSHLEHAREDLIRFEDRWRQGRFDSGRLDRAINNLKHLEVTRQLNGRDRAMVASDIDILRDFRARGGRGY